MGSNDRGTVVVCKGCGQKAYSSEFSMDYEKRLMVCPRCVGARKVRTEAERLRTKNKEADSKKQVEEAAELRMKPAGWDAEDALLERLSKNKEKVRPQLAPIAGSQMYNCTCRKCKYKFKYDPGIDKPKSCPYCATP